MNHLGPRASRTVQENVQDNARTAVTIDDAAAIKGMKVDTLRKRLQRGQEDGKAIWKEKLIDQT